jgi:hypothetical protein
MCSKKLNGSSQEMIVDSKIRDNEYVLAAENGQWIGQTNDPTGEWGDQSVKGHDDPRKARRFATPDEAVEWGLKVGWVQPGGEIRIRSIPKVHRYDDSEVQEGVVIALTPKHPQYDRLAKLGDERPEGFETLYVKDSEVGPILISDHEEATRFASDEDLHRYAVANGLVADHGPIGTRRVSTRFVNA